MRVGDLIRVVPRTCYPEIGRAVRGWVNPPDMYINLMRTHKDFVWVTATLGVLVSRHDTYWRVLVADKLVWLEHYALKQVS
jgi:hypothetical protein